MDARDLNNITEAYQSIISEAPAAAPFKWDPNKNVIAAKGGSLGIMDKGNPTSWRQPSEQEKGEIPVSSTKAFQNSPAGQSFIKQRDAAKATTTTPAPAAARPTQSAPAAPTTAAKPAPSLSDLRTAAAQATMAGPSREAQALMSPRARAILGQQGKLQAGSQAQDKVAQMRSSMPSATSTPRAAINPEWAKANPKLAAAETQRRETSGTSATKNPMMTQDMKSRMPAPAPKAPTTQRTPTAPTAPQQKPTQTQSPTLSQQQQDLYKQAYQNRNNPFAKGRIQSELNKMTPEQKKMFQQYAQSQGQGSDWSNYKFESHNLKTFAEFMNEGTRPTPVDEPLNRKKYNERRRSLRRREQSDDAKRRGHVDKFTGKPYGTEEAASRRKNLNPAEREARRKFAEDPD